ncbi:copper resistance CopC family protein [Pseudonocardia sp. TRM90224]|uniref:copper resistance CopC family protein n=1 Tax=Pseudonocardia sp. TRM90224 TaxID=2812678 RepID=UPI001E335A6F|nr:copper resistance CopC family protein [Pseudonocardia sp. TRM90224]
MNRGALRGAALTLLCTIALVAGAGSAFAHTRLISSDPADGTSLAAAPARVSLTFNETMQPGFSTVTVVGPDGGRYESGEVTAQGGTVAVAVKPLGPAGTYEIGYRVISEDGHPVTGKVAFTLTTAGTATSSAAPATTAAPTAAPTTAAQTTAAPRTEAAPSASGGGDGGAPVWPWIVGAVVAVAAGVFAALRLGRS